MRADSRWKASNVGGREVPVAVVQPHADGAAVHRTARDDVEIVVVIDVDGRDRQRVGRRFEEHVGRRGARERELEAVRVAARAASDVIGNDDIGRAVLIEVADRRRPAERPGGRAEPERRLQRRSRARVRPREPALIRIRRHRRRRRRRRGPRAAGCADRERREQRCEDPLHVLTVSLVAATAAAERPPRRNHNASRVDVRDRRGDASPALRGNPGLRRASSRCRRGSLSKSSPRQTRRKTFLIRRACA